MERAVDDEQYRKGYYATGTEAEKLGIRLERLDLKKDRLCAKSLDEVVVLDEELKDKCKGLHSWTPT